jgi:hypothetical protein
MTIIGETNEDARQLADLETAIGLPGSGRVRYAAAMHFYYIGEIGRPYIVDSRLTMR